MDAEADDERAPCYLIVEDNRFLARALARFFERYGPVVVEHHLHGARVAMSARRGIRALVLDVQLPDGSGLDLLTDLRRRGDRTPALVLSAHGDDDVLRSTQLLHALFLPKPAPEQHLRSFVEWAERQEPGLRLDQEVAALSERRGLTPRETEVVRCVARGIEPSELAGHLGVDAGTIDDVVQTLLDKTSEPSLDAIVKELHRRIFE
jgi:DNA-binding NarL/FixJ family response regulator